jgi:hypothetical protein
MSKLKPHYLCLTSGLFSISLFIYFLTTNKNLEKNVLAFTLFLCLVFSQLFWYNPIQHSLTHKIDAIIAKINAVLFVSFVLFYKNLSWSVKFLYILLGVLSILAFYRSDCFSRQEWCCDDHLINHGLLHIAGFFGSLYVFL